MPMQILAGLVLAAVVSYLAYRLRTLTAGGALAATILGTIVFGLGGWQWAALLLTFFVLSSALTRAFPGAKAGTEEKYAKGTQRDVLQVLSNGGVAGAFVLMHAVAPEAAWPWIGFAGSLAAVNADTWATELGILNPGNPRLITALRRPVEKGTSGGISPVGTLASLLAATAIGFLAAALAKGPEWLLLPVIATAGLAGSLVDSLLGATVQALYFCPVDRKETEKHPYHGCGSRTVHIRGWKWLDNDMVNMACAAVGAQVALLVASIIRLG